MYNIDALSSNSDSACFDAVENVLGELEFGFYENEFELAYPELAIYNVKGNKKIINLEEAFLQDLIDENR
jgi:hypothetical protein